MLSKVNSDREKYGFKKKCIVAFGSYVEARGDPNITNNMDPKTHEYIALVPTRNIQEKQKVLCLVSVKVLKIIKIAPIISIDRIIKKVDDWDKNSIIY